MSRLLLVDDEPAMLFALDEVLREGGHETVLASSMAQALTLLDGVALVVTDYAMPGANGLELLAAIRARDENVPVIVVTAQGSERVAVQAMRAGAFDYITKPFDIDELALTVERALEHRALRLQNRRLSLERTLGRNVVAESAPMRALFELVQRVAPRDITVLVRGETGTGKELIATLLHAASKRSTGPLVRFNCAALPAELAESELFGHTKGAFTGATEERRGFIGEAHGGTLVLDEVGELPLVVQGKLLRALQDGEIQRVGSGRTERVDARVVASTNRDLREEVKAGRFREDLYYRLAVVELVVPPLREHRDDIPALVAEFARRYTERFGMEGARLSPALVRALAAQDWPGNIRQLENAVARLVALSPGGVIDLPALGLGSPVPEGPEEVPAAEPDATPGAALTLREHVDAVERSVIARTMAATGHNQSETARRLGLSRSGLIERLKRYGLSGAR